MIMWMDFIPERKCIYDKYSPKEQESPKDIVIKNQLDFKKHFKVVLSSYVKAHGERAVTNNNNLRKN